jgi:hypothetical protein
VLHTDELHGEPSYANVACSSGLAAVGPGASDGSLTKGHIKHHPHDRNRQFTHLITPTDLFTCLRLAQKASDMKGEVPCVVTVANKFGNTVLNHVRLGRKKQKRDAMMSSNMPIYFTRHREPRAPMKRKETSTRELSCLCTMKNSRIIRLP